MTPTSWDEITGRWRELYGQQAELARSWLDGQAKLAGALAAAVPLALVGGSQVGETIRRLTEGPRFTDLGAVERRMARVMELWLGVQQRARAYEAVVADAWVEASKRFAAEFQERVRAGTAPSEPKEALKLWLDIANRTLLETHRSERFLEAQGELLRHGMDFLLAEREMVESLVEPAGLPTRSEIDEVHRSVLDLKRRMRALEKAATGEPAEARATAPPARRPARRREGARP